MRWLQQWRRGRVFRVETDFLELVSFHCQDTSVDQQTTCAKQTECVGQVLEKKSRERVSTDHYDIPANL
jgi:hypothetical protein